MATVDLSEILAFPQGFPRVTAGAFLRKENILITGHENGLVLRWDMEKKKYCKLFECNSPARAISSSINKEIAVGCDAGALVVLKLEEHKELNILQEPDYSKHSRVWRTVWTGKDSLVVTSTYGVIKYFTRVASDNWKVGYLRGHADSIFGAASSDGRFLATADYAGNIILWEHKDGEFKAIQELDVVGTIQDVCWHKDELFAAVTGSGRVFLFEKESKESNQWQKTYEIDIATGKGNSINVTDDGGTIFAGTDSELIQFDIGSQQTDQHPVADVRKIFSVGDTIYLLTDKGFFTFKRKDVQVQKAMINYRFAKISLLGHTGTGKTTLCNHIIFGSVNNVKSTFGKRIWNWVLPKDNSVEKRVILSDYGGQEAVLETFLPFLKDSDMFLIFYKQTDNTTFERARRILNLLAKKVKADTNVVFVQTFIDHDVNEISETEIQQLKLKGQIRDIIKISPLEKIGLEEFKDYLLKAIPWANTRIMIRSPFTEGISKTLAYIQEKGYPAIAYGKFKNVYQDIIKGKISDRHLKFLLKDYTNQGIIEYYPEIIDMIIFNDANYNKLMTNIPIYAEHKKGIVSIDELRKEFKDSPYLKIIDEVYANAKIVIRNGNLRIFPEKLTLGPIEMPALYKEQLGASDQNILRLPYQTLETSSLIEAFSEMNLQCVRASQKEGIFSWEDVAFIYYSFGEGGNDVSGRYVECTYYIGGKNERRKSRLADEFRAIVDKLFGPLQEDKLPEVSSKKKQLKNTKFDVALSFAGEQRDYIRQVAERLASKGIKVFFDEFFESHLWGKNLPDYLKEVYYSKSGYCIMFISKEYISKMWPVYEGKCATTKDLEEFGEYILPVVFEGVKVPGLDPGKKYLSAKKYTPEQIADMFIDKFEAEEE